MWFVAGARGAGDHNDGGRCGDSDRRTHNLLPAAPARSLPRRQGGGTTLDHPSTHSPRNHRTSQAESSESILTHQQPSIPPTYIRLQPPLLIVTEITTVFSFSLFCFLCFSCSLTIALIYLFLSHNPYLSPSIHSPSLSPTLYYKSHPHTL